MLWWVWLDLVFLVGRTASGGVFRGVCELSMIIGSLSANGCGCVPVLLVCWHWVSQCQQTCLQLACHWVELGLSIEMEMSGRALADWYYLGPGGLWWSNVLNLAIPPLVHQAGAPRPCQPHGWLVGYIFCEGPSESSKRNWSSYPGVVLWPFTPGYSKKNNTTAKPEKKFPCGAYHCFTAQNMHDTFKSLRLWNETVKMRTPKWPRQ